MDESTGQHSTCQNTAVALRQGISTVLELTNGAPPLNNAADTAAEEALESAFSDVTEDDLYPVHFNNNASLLSLILPPHVAKAVLCGMPVKPEIYEDMCVFFSDIAGFTEISSAIEPSLVMTLLHQVYIVMDHCVKLFPDLYKVETIGDSMMVCSWVSEDSSDTHPEISMAEFACLAMRVTKELLRNPLSKRPLELRMGMHRGKTCGGIVGFLMPRYCFFGDAVNVASRMESTSELGKIQISEVMRAALAQHGERFTMSSLASREIKGKGVMQTCWLESGTFNRDEGFALKVLQDLRFLLEPAEGTIARNISFDFRHRKPSSDSSPKPDRTKSFTNIEATSSTSATLESIAASDLCLEVIERRIVVVNASKFHWELICSLLQQAQQAGLHLPFRIALTRITMQGLEDAMRSDESCGDLLVVDSSAVPTLYPITLVRSSPGNSKVPIICLFAEPATLLRKDPLTIFWNFLTTDHALFIKLLMDAIQKLSRQAENSDSGETSSIGSSSLSPFYSEIETSWAKVKPNITRRVLLVEDSLVQLKAISAALVSVFAMADITLLITAVTTGEQAHDFLAMKVPFDFAIVDENLSLGVMQGSDVIRKVHASNKSTPVIGLIGDLHGNGLLMYAAGADCIWPKPLRRGEETFRRLRNLGIIPQD